MFNLVGLLALILFFFLRGGGGGLARFGVEDAERAASAVLAQLEGALLLARTYKSLEPMRRAETAVAMLAGIKPK